MATDEAKKYANVNLVAKGDYKGVPDRSTWNIDERGKYFHYCANETINGVEFKDAPEVGNQVLVADMSSNFMSRPVDVSKFGLIYAAAQKNIGPAGVVIVIIRKDLLGKQRYDSLVF